MAANAEVVEFVIVGTTLDGKAFRRATGPSGCAG